MRDKVVGHCFGTTLGQPQVVVGRSATVGVSAYLYLHFRIAREKVDEMTQLYIRLLQEQTLVEIEKDVLLSTKT